MAICKYSKIIIDYTNNLKIYVINWLMKIKKDFILKKKILQCVYNISIKIQINIQRKI